MNGHLLHDDITGSRREEIARTSTLPAEHPRRRVMVTLHARARRQRRSWWSQSGPLFLARGPFTTLDMSPRLRPTEIPVSATDNDYEAWRTVMLAVVPR